MPQAKKTKADATPVETPARKAEFPKMSLEDALDVPQALQRNGGQPLSSIDMAAAVKRSPGSSGFRTLTASASAYGLISGSYKRTFSMRELGAAITQPTSPEEGSVALVTAALTPGTFGEIYDYYKGEKFPERQFFENTVVREFGVDSKQAATCCDVFEANMRFVGLIRETPGGEWLSTEAAPPAGTAVMTKEEVDAVEEQAAEVEAARALLDAHKARTVALHVLDLTAYEVGNALLRSQAGATAQQVATVLAALGEVCPAVRPDDDELRLAAKLAEQHDLTLYDAAYAAVARQRKARLATLDRELLAAGLGVRPSELVPR